MIAQAKQIQNKILDIKYGRVKEGLGIDIPEIDEYIRYKQGNFNLINWARKCWKDYGNLLSVYVVRNKT